MDEEVFRKYLNKYVQIKYRGEVTKGILRGYSEDSIELESKNILYTINVRIDEIFFIRGLSEDEIIN